MLCNTFIKYLWCDMVFFVAVCMAKNCQKCSSKPNKCIKCKAGYKKNKKGQCGTFTRNTTDGILFKVILIGLNRWNWIRACLISPEPDLDFIPCHNSVFFMPDYKNLAEQVITERNIMKHISVKLQLTALWPMQETYWSWPWFSRDTS